MFETARVRTARRNFGLLSLSFLTHSAIIVAVFAATIASTRLPLEPPKEMLPVFIASPIPLAAGAPLPVSKPKPVAAPPRAPVTPAAAPRTIPDAVVPAEAVPASTGTDLTSSSSAEPGVPDGVPGGLPAETNAPQAPDAAGPLAVGGNVKAPVVLRRVEPIYPRGPLVAHLSGWVVVECIIDKTGQIRDVHVTHSSFGAFEKPAVDAVQQWLFLPGSLNGRPVDTIFELTVRFELK